METLRFTLILVPDLVAALARSYGIRHFVLSALLGMTVPYAAQRWDRGRLPPARQARAWNAASWGAALYAFGPFSMIAWCWVTRAEVRRWSREGPVRCVLKIAAVIAAGVVVTGVVVAVMAVLLSLHAWVSGAPD
jgi:hypothetical protein